MKQLVKRPRFQPATAFLIALSLIFAYSVIQSGGTLRTEWEYCMVALGVLLLLYFHWYRRGDSAPSIQWWLCSAPLLLLAFIVFQLTPIPMAWLQVLSPMRAKL